MGLDERVESPVILQANTLTEGARRAIVESFLSSGSSSHSKAHSTLAYVIDYCEKNRIPYKLTAYPGKGYYIRRLS